MKPSQHPLTLFRCLLSCIYKQMQCLALFALCVPICEAEYVRFQHNTPEPSDPLNLFGNNHRTLNVFFFRATEYALRIADEGDFAPRFGSLAAAMQAHGCVAGVNGGYFGTGPKRSPLGLVRSDGKTISRRASSGFTVAGILYDTGKGIFLERSKHISHNISDMRDAIQGGPFLVENGAIVVGLEKSKIAARTFVATDGKGYWCIGVASPISLHRLASWLAIPGSLGKNFHVVTALNLDGGSSSAFWCHSVSLPGLKPVRNFLGVIPRR